MSAQTFQSKSPGGESVHCDGLAREPILGLGELVTIWRDPACIHGQLTSVRDTADRQVPARNSTRSQLVSFRRNIPANPSNPAPSRRKLEGSGTGLSVSVRSLELYERSQRSPLGSVGSSR